MKKLIALVMFAVFATAALAEPHHPGPVPMHGQGHWRPHGNGWAWVVPAMIGGILTYEIVKTQEQRPVIITEPPVIVQQPPVVVQPRPVCTDWREYIGSDGKIYRERTCQ